VKEHVSDPTANGVNEAQAIKQVCEKAAEPAEIWDTLESKGIDVTPGARNRTRPTKPGKSRLLKAQPDWRPRTWKF